MASRQDRADAQRLARVRAAAALVVRDSDPAQPPFRGAAGASLASVLIAAVALGAVAAWARFGGGAGDDWRDPGAVIVAAETGARYLWRDPLLHPVANYTSAQLLLGDPAPPTVTVPRSALDGVPRGNPLGIPGAPDSLPAPGDLVAAGWSVCSVTGPGGDPRSLLVVGDPTGPGATATAAPRSPAGGARGGPLGDRGLLVQDPSGDPYLVWQRRRYRVRDAPVVLPALGWAGARPVPVAAALVRALPAGPDLHRIELPAYGRPAPAPAGARVGEVFEVTNRAGPGQYAVALPDGLAPLTPVQVALLLSDPRAVQVLGQRQPAPLSPAEYAALPRLDPDAVPDAGWPATAPVLARPDRGAGVCALLADGAGAVAVTVGAVPDLPATAGGAPPATEEPPRLDRVWVRPGRAALVSDGEAVYVVTGLGRRHRTPTAALPLLGYGDVDPVRMPAPVVTLIPAGPALDPTRARGGDG